MGQGQVCTWLSSAEQREEQQMDMREASKEWPEMVDFPPEDAGKPSQGPFHCLWTMGPGAGEEEDRKEGFLGFHEASLLVASLQVGMVRMGREVA